MFRNAFYSVLSVWKWAEESAGTADAVTVGDGDEEIKQERFP